MAVRTLPNGTFRVDVQVRGVRLRETFQTLKEAKAHEQWIRRNPDKAIDAREEKRGVNKPSGITTMGDLLDKVYDTFWFAEHTGGGYQTTLRLIREHFGNLPVEKITTEDIDLFIRKELERGMANDTVNKRLTTISKALSYALDNDLILKKPKIRRLPKVESRRRIFSTEEVNSIRQVLERFGHDDMGRYVALMFNLGTRPEELLLLKRNDVRFDLGSNGLVNISAGKTGRERAVPLTPNAKKIMEEQLKASPAKGAERIFKFSYGTFKYQWNKAREWLGMASDEGWVPYTLRHTFGSVLAQRGTSVATIQNLMGHEDIKQTMAYIKLYGPHLSAGIANLPDLDA
jgi:integrase/recombinase XerD